MFKKIKIVQVVFYSLGISLAAQAYEIGVLGGTALNLSSSINATVGTVLVNLDSTPEKPGWSLTLPLTYFHGVGTYDSSSSGVTFIPGMEYAIPVASKLEIRPFLGAGLGYQNIGAAYRFLGSDIDSNVLLILLQASVQLKYAINQHVAIRFMPVGFLYSPLVVEMSFGLPASIPIFNYQAMLGLSYQF